MGRRVLIEDDELMDRLSRDFRDVGYEGATLAILSRATGLQKASLYHRFPGGKEQIGEEVVRVGGQQMAREVLEAAESWLVEHVLTPLQGEGTPRQRVDRMVTALDRFYSGGKQSCLLNTLSTAVSEEGPFAEKIAGMFGAFIDVLSAVLIDAGYEQKEARSRASRAVIMMEGSLVLSRGMGTTEPFREFLKSLPADLLG